MPAQLRPTPQQVLGPYFIPNSPLRQRQFPTGTSGSAVAINGQVMSIDCKPIAGATVHVWVADPSGKYDNQDSQGNPIIIAAAKQRYRGRIIADQSGAYTFECLRPGNYFDSGWNLWRPSHIHIMVEAPGHKRLITQLYFDDDAQNTHDIPGDDFFLPELALQLSPAIPAAGITQKGIFNFVLEVAS